MQRYEPRPPPTPPPKTSHQPFRKFQKLASTRSSMVTAADFSSIPALSRSTSLLSDGSGLMDLPEIHRLAKLGDLKRLLGALEYYSQETLNDNNASSTDILSLSSTNTDQQFSSTDTLATKINEPTTSRVLPIHFACQGGNVPVISLLVTNGADYYALDQNGYSCVHYVCQQPNTDAVKYLIEELELPFSNVPDFRIGYHPIHVAASYGNANIIRYLLSKGAEKDVFTKRGLTALHISCEKGHLESTKVLLEHGCKINSRTSRGLSTPLHLACSRGHLHIIQLLIEKGNALVDLINEEGHTPFFIAGINGHVHILQYLIAIIATKPNSSFVNELELRDVTGRTVLDYAIQTKKLRVVELLLLLLSYTPNTKLRIQDFEDELVRNFGKSYNDILKLANKDFAKTVKRAGFFRSPLGIATVAVVGIALFRFFRK